MVNRAINTSIPEADRRPNTARKNFRRESKVSLGYAKAIPYKGAYPIVEEHNVRFGYSTVARILKRSSAYMKKKKQRKS